jgi:hypothetical protein
MLSTVAFRVLSFSYRDRATVESMARHTDINYGRSDGLGASTAA